VETKIKKINIGVALNQKHIIFAASKNGNFGSSLIVGIRVMEIMAR